jgi:hypothetical protein
MEENEQKSFASFNMMSDDEEEMQFRQAIKES